MGAPPPPWFRPTLENGFSQTAAPQPLCAYHRDALGYVHTKIGMTHVVGPAAGAVAFTYGLGFRPSETMTFTLSDSFGLTVMLQLNGAGELSTLTPLPAAVEVRGYFIFLAEF